MHTTPVPMAQLVVSTLNVRKTLDTGQDDSNIEELATSIREKGLLSPLTVRPLADGRFEILVGQRRYLACKLVPLDPVPCLIKEGLSDADAISLSLIENVHRADMHPIDKAKALQALLAKFGSYESVAKESACSVPTIRRYLKLLELPTVLQDRIGTADGPSGISALSRLASTFSGEEAVLAYNEISGFTQRVQEEILKRCDGSLQRLDDLVEEAQEGVFDIRRCGAASECQLINDIVQGRMSESEFSDRIKSAALRTGTGAPTSAILRNAATSFWRALARVDG
ncbi:ParB/RepB/Spo0J family partition protein [Roseiarcaceae bacterium H3SJ34-1]|jgi:ParB/RepB/Spo0J family partition protein|uniref:ParB/RepB/Spo0J family partition protein n=1 Tax=Terripilifer ovatus TaxID=3032367 RepID=UPI003AB9AB54|nr:ParB/RepB/Spo0J family partition protein [Roseiarcaceae bacterium H3SJ34-1]